MARKRRKKREAADCLGRKVAGHQKLHSLPLEKALTMKTMILGCIHLIEQRLDSFGGRMVLPAKTMVSRARFCFVTPPTVQMFLPRSAGGSAVNCAEGSDSSSSSGAAPKSTSVERLPHSSGGVMAPMGPGLRQLRVSPIKGFLEPLLADVSGRVERLLRARTCHKRDSK